MKKYEQIKKNIEQTEGLLHKHLETNFLFDVASSLPKQKNILEIGSYKGLSSLCLAFGANNIEGNLFCISLWTNEIYNYWQENMKKNNLRPTAIAGNANLILNNLQIENLGMVFIDSSHSYEDCKVQFELSTRNLRESCLVAFHDYEHPNYPGVKKYCDEIKNSNKLINTEKIGCIFYGYTN